MKEATLRSWCSNSCLDISVGACVSDAGAREVVVDERLKDKEVTLPAMTVNFYARGLKLEA